MIRNNLFNHYWARVYLEEGFEKDFGGLAGD